MIARKMTELLQLHRPSAHAAMLAVDWTGISHGPCFIMDTVGYNLWCVPDVVRSSCEGARNSSPSPLSRRIKEASAILAERTLTGRCAASHSGNLVEA